jgi:hypothetical protein
MSNPDPDRSVLIQAWRITPATGIRSLFKTPWMHGSNVRGTYGTTVPVHTGFLLLLVLSFHPYDRGQKR